MSKLRGGAAGPLLLALILAPVLPAQAAPAEQVRFSRGKSVVPTYAFERSEIVAPLFRPLENMGLYPYTLLDWESRSRRPVPVEYESLVLENEHLRVEFLPELGGRIWSAFDKKEPIFDPVRGDPRFTELVRGMRLE